MQFCFYPQREYACLQVNHCPHLGGAALGRLVAAAGDHDQYLKMLLGQVDFERHRQTSCWRKTFGFRPRSNNSNWS